MLAPDRTSYSVKNMPAASGGTAIDVLRNIPLVEVDGSNNVSLRGNANVVVQINGRSTPLKGDQLGAFLAQLPAGTVKNVEVATNPSAKDDPEGTAGIINIVLNQEARARAERRPLRGHGVDRAGQRERQRRQAAGQAHAVRVGKHVSRSNASTSGTISRTNLVVPVPAFTETRSGRQASRRSPAAERCARSTDSRERNTLSFDGFFYGGRFGGDQSSAYTDLDAAARRHRPVRPGHRRSRSRNLSQDYDVTFRRHDATRTRRSSRRSSSTRTTHGNSDIDLVGQRAARRRVDAARRFRRSTIDTVGRYPYLNWKTDYTRPVRRERQSSRRDSRPRGARRRTTSTPPISNAGDRSCTSPLARATAFDYHEDIGAGVRAALEQVRQGADADRASARGRGDLPRPDDGRPAVRPPLRERVPERDRLVQLHADCAQARISYSRRVSRPNPYQLSPIEFQPGHAQRLPRQSRSCAPSTRTRSRSAIRSRGRWGSIQLNPYLRSTAHAVRNIQFVDSTGVSVSTFDNVASTLTVGVGSQRQRPHGPAAARRRRKPLSLLERRVEPRRQPFGARDGVVGAHERDVEVLAEGGRAGVRVLSRAVRDGGRLAARVGRR